MGRSVDERRTNKQGANMTASDTSRLTAARRWYKRLAAAPACVLVALLCVAADQVVRGKFTVIGEDGKDKVTLGADGNVEVAGRLKVKGVDIAAAIEEIEEEIKKVNKGPAAKAPAVKVGEATVILVGVNENTAGPQSYQFKAGGVQEYKHDVGREVLAAWPVIRDKHGDVNGNARFWREWAGYFGVRASGRSIIVYGTPQDKGRYSIDILYLYVE